MNMLSVSRKGKKKHVYKRVSKQTCLEGGKRRRRKRTTTEHTHTHRERERERESWTELFLVMFPYLLSKPLLGEVNLQLLQTNCRHGGARFWSGLSLLKKFFPFSCPVFYLRKKEERKGRRTWWPLCPRRRSRFTTNTKCFSFHRPADFWAQRKLSVV